MTKDKRVTDLGFTPGVGTITTIDDDGTIIGERYDLGKDSVKPTPLPGSEPPYCVICGVREGYTDHTDLPMCDKCRSKGVPVKG